MCGIFAALGERVPDDALDMVIASLRHRGPDGDGMFRDDDVPLTIAHTRLAVIDLQTGAQPLSSSDGNLVLAANGEIYDFESIRTSLELSGHRFRTHCDSEVILHLYEEHGIDCLSKLRGEFAFLMYDRAKGQLIAVRDRFGIKPLYFARTRKGFVFASEMKAIFASGLVEAKLNAAALDPMIEQDADRPRFPFEGVEQVPPGCFMTIDLATMKATTKRYWSPEIPAAAAEPVEGPLGDAPAEAAAMVLSELEEAVRLRLRADVPVGLYLSGGIDSAFVGALMQRNLGKPLHSFSIGFEGSERNEQDIARHAAEVLGTVHHELSVTKDMLWAGLEDCLWHSELPFVSLAPVGKFLLSQEARKWVTVVLTGEGADEVFLGYRRFFRQAIRDMRSPIGSGRSSQLRRLKLGLMPASVLKRLSLLLFHKSRRSALAAARANADARPNRSGPLVNVVQEQRIAAMPLDILCFLGDREEMAHSLEARLPFLDHALYDAAKSIPVDFKMREGVEKAVLRDAAIGILPEELRLRRKLGFMLTSDAVDLFGEDRSAARDLRPYLSKDAFERAGVFSYRAYRWIGAIARLPGAKRFRYARQFRRDANKILMYMLQTHMLHEMFIASPRWANRPPRTTPAGTELRRKLAA